MPKRTQLLVVAAACALSIPAWGQATPPKGQLNARELFYAAREEAAKPKAVVRSSPAKPAVTKGASAKARPVTPSNPPPSSSPVQGNADIIPAAYSSVPLGLRYTVLKRSGDRNVEVAPSTIFHSGDRIQLAVEVNDRGFLYIVSRGSSGTWEVLFPSPKIERGDNRVESGRHYVLPPGYVFSFTGKPGVEKLFVIFSRQPEPEIDRLIYSLQGRPAPAAEPAPSSRQPAPTMLASAAPLRDSLIGQFRNLYSRDLIIEKVEDEDPGKSPGDKGVYVVNPKGSADSRVVADIELTHQ